MLFACWYHSSLCDNRLKERKKEIVGRRKKREEGREGGVKRGERRGNWVGKKDEKGRKEGGRRKRDEGRVEKRKGREREGSERRKEEKREGEREGTVEGGGIMASREKRWVDKLEKVREGEKEGEVNKNKTEGKKRGWDEWRERHRSYRNLTYKYTKAHVIIRGIEEVKTP